jgi:hypothetical protein
MVLLYIRIFFPLFLHAIFLNLYKKKFTNPFYDFNFKNILIYKNIELIYSGKTKRIKQLIIITFGCFECYILTFGYD